MSTSGSSADAPSSALTGDGGANDPVTGRSGAASRFAGAGTRAWDFAGRFAVVGGFVVMVIVFGVLEPDAFMSTRTFENILNQAAVPVILVCGLTFVLVVGEFDLSYTATLGVGAAIAISLMAKSGWSVGPAVVLTLLACAAVGLIVGVLVTLGHASSFIVTLAIGSVVTGLELAMTDNQTVYEGIPSSYGKLTTTEILGFGLPVWLALVALVLAVVLLHGTRFGRHAKAVGGNTTAAYLAGVRVRRIKILSFVLVAFLAGIAAIIVTSRASSYFPNASAGFLLNTYAAAFLGAAIGARSGFTVAGSALGVLWMTTLQTGLTITNQPAWTSSFIQGLVLAIAVLLSARGSAQRA